MAVVLLCVLEGRKDKNQRAYFTRLYVDLIRFVHTKCPDPCMSHHLLTLRGTWDLRLGVAAPDVPYCSALFLPFLGARPPGPITSLTYMSLSKSYALSKSASLSVPIHYYPTLQDKFKDYIRQLGNAQLKVWGKGAEQPINEYSFL